MPVAPRAHAVQRVHADSYGEDSNSFPALGFTQDGGVQRSDGAYQGPYYTNTLSRWDLGGVPNTNYRATATGAGSGARWPSPVSVS